MAGDTIKRRINFYLVGAYALDPKVNTLVEVDTLDEALQDIAALVASYNHPSSRYLKMNDGSEVYMAISSVTEKAVRGHIAFKRRTDLPPIESDGTYSDIPLTRNAGLAEISHFTFYPEVSVLGCEWNFYAPRVGKWCEYVERSSARVEQVNANHLITGEALDQIEQNRVAAGEITVLRDKVDVVKSLDVNLWKALRAVRRANPKALKVTVGMELGSRKKSTSLDSDWVDQIRDFLSGNADSIDAFHVRAWDDRANATRTMNLLDDVFVSYRKVKEIGASSNRVDPESMFTAIDSGFRELRERMDFG